MLNNVTAMIIIGSLTTVSLSKLQRNDLLLGFLLIEGLLTNVGGLLTLISSVPNIIVGNTAGISFVKFFLVAAPYVAIATAVTLIVGKWRFKISGLKTAEEKQTAAELVAGFDENENIPSQRFYWFSVGALVCFIAVLSMQSYLPWNLDKLGMGFVALFFAGVVLLAYRHEVDKFYAAVDWDLLAFFAGLFVVINVMENAQVLAMIGHGIQAMLDLPDGVDSGLLLASSAVASSVTDNIPLAAMLANILDGMETPGRFPVLVECHLRRESRRQHHADRFRLDGRRHDHHSATTAAALIHRLCRCGRAVRDSADHTGDCVCVDRRVMNRFNSLRKPARVHRRR